MGWFYLTTSYRQIMWRKWETKIWNNWTSARQGQWPLSSGMQTWWTPSPSAWIRAGHCMCGVGKKVLAGLQVVRTELHLAQPGSTYLNLEEESRVQRTQGFSEELWVLSRLTWGQQHARSCLYLCSQQSGDFQIHRGLDGAPTSVWVQCRGLLALCGCCSSCSYDSKSKTWRWRCKTIIKRNIMVITPSFSLSFCFFNWVINTCFLPAPEF